MQINSSTLLINHKQSTKELKKFNKFLKQINTISFWKHHFQKHGFVSDTGSFTWKDWETLPFCSKADFLDSGIKKRLRDAKAIIKNDYLRFLFQTTSGTSQLTKPILYLKNVDYLTEGEEHTKGKRTIFFLQPYHIALRDTLAHIHRSKKENNTVHSLTINPFKVTPSMVTAIHEFNADSILTFPAGMAYVTSLLPKLSQVLPRLKKIWLVGDFLSNKQQSFIKSKFRNVYIDLDYVTTDIDSVGVCCRYLQKRYGLNVYHPNPDRIIELINSDSEGYGEVVVTKTTPLELSIIRFRTGDIAKAKKEICVCGSQWTLFMEGRKDMDYIKGLGVLITRAEVESALKNFHTFFEDWRGEVREISYNEVLLGELTLLVKLKKNLILSPKDWERINNKISADILLTPKKTLLQLVQEGKFMPLKFQIVRDFPTTPKKIMLRKILR